jgi:hypothetical protein
MKFGIPSYILETEPKEERGFFYFECAYTDAYQTKSMLPSFIYDLLAWGHTRDTQPLRYYYASRKKAMKHLRKACRNHLSNEMKDLK